MPSDAHNGGGGDVDGNNYDHVGGDEYYHEDAASPAAGAPAVVVSAGVGEHQYLSASDTDARAKALAEWEAQLLEYNAQLGEVTTRHTHCHCPHCQRPRHPFPALF